MKDQLPRLRQRRADAFKFIATVTLLAVVLVAVLLPLGVIPVVLVVATMLYEAVKHYQHWYLGATIDPITQEESSSQIKRSI